MVWAEHSSTSLALAGRGEEGGEGGGSTGEGTTAASLKNGQLSITNLGFSSLKY